MNALILLLDILLAFLVIYLLFPILFGIGNNSPIVLAILIATGVLIAIYEGSVKRS